MKLMNSPFTENDTILKEDVRIPWLFCRQDGCKAHWLASRRNQRLLFAKLYSRLGESTTNTVPCTHRKAWKVLELLLDTRVGRLGRVQYTEPGLRGLRLTKPKETIYNLTMMNILVLSPLFFQLYAGYTYTVYSGQCPKLLNGFNLKF